MWACVNFIRIFGFYSDRVFSFPLETSTGLQREKKKDLFWQCIALLYETILKATLSYCIIIGIEPVILWVLLCMYPWIVPSLTDIVCVTVKLWGLTEVCILPTPLTETSSVESKPPLPRNLRAQSHTTSVWSQSKNQVLTLTSFHKPPCFLKCDHSRDKTVTYRKHELISHSVFWCTEGCSFPSFWRALSIAVALAMWNNISVRKIRPVKIGVLGLPVAPFLFVIFFFPPSAALLQWTVPFAAPSVSPSEPYQQYHFYLQRSYFWRR